MGASWFADLMGFGEDGYESTRSRLAVDGDELVSTVTGARYGIGELTLPTLAELRARVDPTGRSRSTVSAVAGDARAMHSEPELAGALFQVASQFNVLEMVSPGVTPEQGVTGYAGDHTQGPACALAAGAATIYRNYLVPVDGQAGQARDRQLDALAPMGAALSAELDRPVGDLWEMRNGYALGTADGLAAISDLLAGADEELRDRLRAQLAIGLHRNVQVTDVRGEPRRYVSQAFCSALPVAYSHLPALAWESFARLVLEASYEATLLAAAEQALADGSPIVLLTRVGGGVFGNAPGWIDAAIERALAIVEYAGLDIRLVGYGQVNPSSQAIAERWG
ncbi:hypothetical protein [Mycobacterium sp. 1274756.6]|uniref:hypothetical protein n=1 Tax=Mycobacterium sp. 1274756.6 TaxID=1834076 RepID=UPI0007FFE192|nr:hypothetical protein [Mycobacterium sp. 1274756.6]OBJ70971.1 hypothetical protein A5643_08725 [Mycobacterium sp. 1274756.6]